MTHREESTLMPQVMQLLDDHGLDSLRPIFRVLLNEAMKCEREQVLQAAAYERTAERRGYANGFKPKTVATRVGAMELAVPQVRGGIKFYPSALEKGVRSERALKAAIAEMYLQGVSTRKVTKVLEELCGLELTSSQVSRVAQTLDEELAPWRARPLDAVPYLLLDARYEPVRVAGSVRSCAVLIAIGILPNGKRSVLGVSVSLSEAEVHWREFLGELQRRGVHGLAMITSDDHPGLRAALTARFPSVPWQRCQCHLQRNAQEHCPKVAWRAALADGLRDVFAAPDRPEADRRLAALVAHYQPLHQDLADWLEANLPEGLTVYTQAAAVRTRLRTSNGVENLNRQVLRRTRLARPFVNPTALLRLVSAVLMETSEEWETGKVYLNLQATPPRYQ